MVFTNKGRLEMICEICNNKLTTAWKVKNSVAPNVYRVEATEKYKTSLQVSHHCAACNYIKNDHQFTLTDIFKDYTYRSPMTTLDEPIAKRISEYCAHHDVKSVVEIGGNNGVFAYKTISLAQDLKSYTIYDKVPIEVNSRILLQKKEFLSSETEAYAVDFVIARHAFAHNTSISIFAKNIVEKFSPEHIYVECADWNLTQVNRDFGQLYSEHFYCLSAWSVSKLFEPLGYNVVEVNNFGIHNGSFGLFLSKSSRKVMQRSDKLELVITDEISKWRQSIRRAWSKANELDIIIWGASAKIIFIINALELSTHNIKAIHDSTIAKYNLYPPGINIKISQEAIEEIDYGSYSVIVGAKNFSSILVPKIKKKYPNSEIIYL